LSQHGSELKYILLIVVILAMIMSIRTYLNFVAIEDAIIWVEQDSYDLQDEIFFVKKFQMSYLSSYYADYFLAHENNVLFPWEVIIKFEDMKSEIIEKEDTLNNLSDQNVMSEKEAWEHFWWERIYEVKNKK